MEFEIKPKGIPVYIFEHPVSGKELYFVPQSANPVEQAYELLDWAREQGINFEDVSVGADIYYLPQGYN